MDEYLLTICIPTYNRATYLKGLVENIYSEIDSCGSSDDVQVLVVDGKSEDNTSGIIDELRSTKKVKYFRRENKHGIDRDILKCVEIAEGKYCWLFSDDDRLMPGAIKYILDILRKEDYFTGLFCNRISYDFPMERRVAEVNGWPGIAIKENRLFTNKSKCIKSIGMDFGFISSQIVKRSDWQKVVEAEKFEGLYNSYYLMVHIICRMMDNEFRWLFINKPLVKQRTGNDSLLGVTGIMERQRIEHNNYEKIMIMHYHTKSEEYRVFFKKMVDRLPRVLANIKSQGVSYKTQYNLFKLYYNKYNNYNSFWFKVVPIFIIPNNIFAFVKIIYFKYWIK